MSRFTWYAAGGTLAMIAYLSATFIRDPVSPPRIYYKPPSVQEALEVKGPYNGENVELSMTPVFVHKSEGMVEYPLMVGLREGDTFFEARAADILGSLRRTRPANRVDDEKSNEVHEILRQRIASGNSQPITLRGRLDADNMVLKTYSIEIDGHNYPLLKYNPNQ